MGTTRPTPPTVTEVLSEYVRQRQQRTSAEATLKQLQPLLARLGDEGNKRFFTLIRSWETREGHKFRPLKPGEAPPPPEPAETQHMPSAAPPPPAPPPANFAPEETPTPIPPVPAANVDSLLAPPAPGEDLSWLAEVSPSAVVQPAPVQPQDAVQGVICPQCGRINRIDEATCYACGAMLNPDEPGSTRPLEPDEIELYQVKRAHFGQYSSLAMQVRGAKQPIIIQLDRPDMVIGRSSSGTDYRPDIDLAAYDGANLGVSRRHARLRYENSTLTLTDLDSVNRTYINGQRLHPHEVRVLQDGDELRLGQLFIRVAFQHQVRRLK